MSGLGPFGSCYPAILDTKHVAFSNRVDFETLQWYHCDGPLSWFSVVEFWFVSGLGPFGYCYPSMLDTEHAEFSNRVNFEILRWRNFDGPFSCFSVVEFWFVSGLGPFGSCTPPSRTQNMSRFQIESISEACNGTILTDRCLGFLSWSFGLCQAWVRSGLVPRHT